MDLLVIADTFLPVVGRVIRTLGFTVAGIVSLFSRLALVLACTFVHFLLAKDRHNKSISKALATKQRIQKTYSFLQTQCSPSRLWSGGQVFIQGALSCSFEKLSEPLRSIAVHHPWSKASTHPSLHLHMPSL